VHDRHPDITAGGMNAWQLPRDASGPPLARSLLARTMTTLGLPQATVDNGVLAVSECATNAHQHAEAAGPHDPLTPPELWVFARTHPMPELVVSVFDTDRTHLPHPTHAQPLDAGGRGIRILSAVTTAWGTRPSRSRLTTPPARGKAVWFRVPLPHSWATQCYTISPDYAASELLLAVAARGIEGTRRNDGNHVTLIEYPGLNVWVAPTSFSWLDRSGVRICHPLIDLHEATDSLIHHLETRPPSM
jgi:Histidine kinase-like ATPase domain